ncbi:MAG TPA: protein translocase subunit SecF [Mycobacteriales bacterium]|jgi:preprotein translocase subunit SecF|nr:protein translocase subunit SecF [Mycobacteriales bacterium]
MTSVFRQMYGGQTSLDFIGRRKVWYLVALVLLLVSLASFMVRGFNFGIEFSGGNSFVIPARAGVTLQEAERAVAGAGAEVVSAQELRGAARSYLIRTGGLSETRSATVKAQVAQSLGIPVGQISDNRVSPSWGSQITNQALLGLVIFLVLVTAYLAFRYEWRMAVGAMAALVHDLVLTAGVYSLVGFEVTPSTVIGLLTILGFSLYDTVVVFDKVAENTKGILGGTRYTYSEAANLAVNQTLMRSINTSLIALLPVAGLLFIGAGLLGAGTLKDLGLVLFVGMAAGAYSSIFLATPVVAELKEREPRYAALRARVLAKRSAEASRKAAPVGARATGGTTTAVLDEAAGDDAASTGRGARPAARPQQRKRAGGKPGRPSGSKRRR